MSSRNLELSIRARADTRDLEKLSRELGILIADLRKTDSAFSSSSGSARQMSGAVNDLTAAEAKQVQAVARTVSALEQAATARERSNRAAADALSAEQRITVAQEAATQAAIKTATANERLLQSQSNTAAVAARTAAAEEKLTQERHKSYQAMAKTEKGELDVAKAREQLRVATVRAEQAEKKAAETKKSYGLATDMVRKQVAAFVSGAALVQAGRMMLDFGRSALSAAADVEEGAAKFDQVFRDLSGGVETNLKSMAEANRRSIYDLKDFASELQNTFVPLGFARDEAAALSQTITQLGIDIAAFSNKADADVIHNLTSAIVGNHMAVRSYGIVITETVIKQELMKNGWADLTGEALEVAKAQARLNIIMRASADAQGAAVREADSYTNTLKAWDAAVLDLKVALGEQLIPAMTQLVEVAIQAAEVLGASGAFQAPFKAGLEAAQSVDDMVQVVRESKKELDDLDFWDWIKVNSTSFAGPEMAADQLQRIAELSQDATEFQKIATTEFSKFTRDQAILSKDLGGYFDWGEWFGPLEAVDLDKFYEVVKFRQEAARATDELTEMEAAYQAQLEKAQQSSSPMASFEPTDNFAARREYLDYLEFLTARSAEAAEAQKALHLAYGEAFNSAPVDDLARAYQALADATEGQEGQASRAYSGDIEAAKEARRAISEANEAIIQSHKQRAYESLAASLIESGQFEHLADLAVSLGIMSAEEANLRQQYAETSATLDALLASTELYSLTAEQQAGAIKSIAAGIYETADAAIAAQQALESTQQFYNTAPDSTQIGEYYRNLANGMGAATAGVETGVTTTVSVLIDPTTETVFRGFRKELEEYGRQEYVTTIDAVGVDKTQDDFEKMRDVLGDLTAEAWVIKVKYETEGAAGGGGGHSSASAPGGANADRDRSRSSPYVDLTVNNYGGENVTGAVRTGVLAAFRSLG